MLLNNTAHFLAMDVAYEEADVIVFGAPFDGTTSYRPGTRFAANGMRNESDGIETYSPLLDLDIATSCIRDVGDLEFPRGNTVKILAEIKKVTQKILTDQKKPLMLGGEHLVTLPVIEAIVETYPDVNLLQLDAHTDLRDTYLGETLSHATVIRRCWDLLGDGRIFQFGIRSGTKTEFGFSLVENHTYLERFAVTTFKDILHQLVGKDVYVTIDLDVLDPALFPGTGTPEPGGLTYRELETIFLALKEANINLVGADIVELSPHYDHSNVSTIVACKVLRELSLLMAHK